MNETLIIIALRAAAVGQCCIALLSTQLPRLLHWEGDIARMSLLVREVFRIHGWFIAITLVLFAVWTWRFAPEMASGGNPAAAWIAGGIALFWGVRSVLQWTFYSPEHWRGKPRETAAHWTLTVIYAVWTVLYGTCAFR